MSRGNQRKIAYYKRVNKDKRCYYCGCVVYAHNRTVDHKTPLCRGGADKPHNYCICCLKCNIAKGDMTEEEFQTFLDTGVKPSIPEEEKCMTYREARIEAAKKDGRTMYIDNEGNIFKK